MVNAKTTGWFQLQPWVRDTKAPVLSLGQPGAFDETHMFAPCAIHEGGNTLLWYCGSRGDVEYRVYRLGLATSNDGVSFTKHPMSPVLEAGNGMSVLTPAILRNPDGSAHREQGRLRLWFSACDFSSPGGRHTLHETGSLDGVAWEPASGPQIENAYAPTVMKDADTYRMWFTDVSTEPWCIRSAVSDNGHDWRVSTRPVLQIDQTWEHERLFYPTVLKLNGMYLMWYGSYSNRPGAQLTTALGFAISEDGTRWQKHPANPVFRPDPSRDWESHYTTSESILQLPDGSWRMWYASRPKPPFLHKYFAIGTARWAPPNSTPMPRPTDDRLAFVAWQAAWRNRLLKRFGVPRERVPLESEFRGQLTHDGLVIEKWIFTSERGSRVPGILYRPEAPVEYRMPALVLSYGHGGSKSQPDYQYCAQVFAKLGIVCLAIDPIGEEERHRSGDMGTRAHDSATIQQRANTAGRLIMGKLVLDTMRGLDFLAQRSDVDSQRLGVAGNSLGGAIAGWMAGLDSRLRFAIISGWAFTSATDMWGKCCTHEPNQRMFDTGLSWDAFLSLAAPHCALRIANGDTDPIVDLDASGRVWRDTEQAAASADAVYAATGRPGGISTWYEPKGGHRPYPAHRSTLAWLVRHAAPAGWSPERVQERPHTNFGQWCETHGFELEPLYGTRLHLLGASVADLGVTPLDRSELAVLKPHELGCDDYTIEGWLKGIASSQAS